MLRAILKVPSAQAEAVSASLRPEAGRELPRTRSAVRTEDGAAVIEIAASDSSAMRAALNSYLECVRIIEDIEELTRCEK
jgi:KEOPS complex subunit Pcc1